MSKGLTFFKRTFFKSRAEYLQWYIRYGKFVETVDEVLERKDFSEVPRIQVRTCDAEGRLHSYEDKPALIDLYPLGDLDDHPICSWHRHGKAHREHGQAVIGYRFDGTTYGQWFIDGVEFDESGAEFDRHVQAEDLVAEVTP